MNKKIYDEFRWKLVDAKISDEKGNTIFEQKGVEVPEDWSQQAANIVASKYFYGKMGTPEREHSVYQLVWRVCNTMATWGYEKEKYFESEKERDDFRDNLMRTMLEQKAAFNSPVWFNVGLWHEYRAGKDSGIGGWHIYGNRNSKEDLPAKQAKTQYEYPQCSACFIQSVKDDMSSIMNLAISEAMLFKHGSGTGTNLSTIRSKRERLAGGGRPSGPMSFLKVYDRVADVVKSGGKTRRAAKMNTLDDWHGDIEEFIDAKQLEEKKAWALIEQGYDGSYNGAAYGSVAYQNENLSVRATDEFMKAAIDDEEWKTYALTTGEVLEVKRAITLLRKIAEGTHVCGDPGMQYDGAIQKWHTCKASGRINSTNPCSEYVFLDETACNLASINLLKFWKDGEFDIDHFEATIRLLITAMDIIVDNASYPTAEIASQSHKFRTLGLGYANLGALIMSMGLPYDSDEARSWAGSITAFLTATAYDQSGKLAELAKTPFQGYEENKACMKEVLEMHQDAAKNGREDALWMDARTMWKNAVSHKTFRNAQVSVIAPTGTIAFMMDCDTTGIEPDIALVKYKLLAGGGMLKIVNKTVHSALDKLGYNQLQIKNIMAWIEEHDTIEGCDILKPTHLEVFDCAFKPAKGERSIRWQAHLKMMEASQPFVSGAISKTINMPEASTVEDIMDAYIEAWRMGLKCVAIYRDGSKRSQPLNTSKEDEQSAGGFEEPNVLPTPRRQRLPDTRQSITHKFKVADHEGYVTMGLYEDGRPGEMFVTINKEGSTIRGLMDCIGTLTSMALQYGVPLDVLANKFAKQRFEPAGLTNNPDIRFATSLVDYIFRWMGSLHLEAPKALKDGADTQVQTSNKLDAPLCPECGVQTEPSGACHRCPNCGVSLGCS